MHYLIKVKEAYGHQLKDKIDKDHLIKEEDLFRAANHPVCLFIGKNQEANRNLLMMTKTYLEFEFLL
jgi:hypothetical protein